MAEAQPNPYNAHKDWHDVEEHEFVSSESLFVPQKRKPAEAEDPGETATPQGDVDWKKRHDDLKKHYDNTVGPLRQSTKQLEAEIEALKKGSQTVQQPAPLPEEAAEYARNNPELMQVIDSVASKRAEPLKQELETLRASDSKRRKLEAQEHLKAVHPDIEAIRSSMEFHDWAEKQSESIQGWIYNNPYDGELAAAAVTLYKSYAGIGGEDATEEPTKSSQPDAASLVPTRTSGANTGNEPKIWSRREIAKMRPAEYEKYEDEIDQAILEGRIVP